MFERSVEGLGQKAPQVVAHGSLEKWRGEKGGGAGRSPRPRKNGNVCLVIKEEA